MTIHHAPNRTSTPGRGKTRSLRLLTAALITPMIAVPLAAAAPVAATPAEAPAAPAVAKASDTEPTAIESAHLDATDVAKESGKPTPVDGLTTGQSQVVAQPDGSFTMTSSPETVRVEEGGEWQPVDTRLVRNADGTLSPARAAIDLTFSGGGKAPMLEIANNENKSIGFTWPKELPEPTLDGNVATYAEVLPGVDLKLVAYADSFGEILVVKNAEAAANPALRQLTLGTVTRGLELTENAQGGLAAVDANGDAVFSGPAPYMWDSANAEPGSPSPSAEDSESGKVTEIGLSVDKAKDKATLTPPASALAGPGVDYPVFIDPSMSGASDDTKAGSHELTVHEAGWDYFNDPVQPLRVGYCGWYGGDSNCNDAQQLKSRSYFSFYINFLHQHDNVEIFAAKVTAKQIHVANCNSPQPTELWTSGLFNESSQQHWPGPRGAKLQTDSGGCSGSYLTYGGWSAGDPVKEYVKRSVVAGQTAIQFNVSAANESDRNQWKKLDSPELEVMYNFRPGAPYGLKVDGARECPGEQRYIYDDTPVLESRAYNYGRNVGVEYEILRASDSAPLRWSKDPLLVASDSVAKWYANGTNTNSQTPLPDGTYRMRARSTTLESDGTNLKSDYTTSYTYVLDTLNPAKPVVSSIDYPRDYWGSMSGAPGEFTLSSSSDTQAFIYSIDTSGGQIVPDITDCTLTEYTYATRGLVTADASGDVSFNLRAGISPGPHKLYVKAIDEAGRVSEESTAYSFYVTRDVEGTTGPLRLTPTPSSPPREMFTNTAPYAVDGSFHQIVATNGTADSPSTVELKFWTYLDAADYALGIGLIEANHFGKVRFRLDGKEIFINDARKYVDTYNASARSTFVELGGAHLTAGVHTLKIEIYGTTALDYTYNGTYGGVPINNVHDNGYTIGIDYLTRVPINNVTFASLQDALNNNGITPLGTEANIGPSTAHSGIPLEALTAKEMAPGSTKIINGVSFPMPAQDAEGDDNVIAMGQTIKLPNKPVAKKVHLLVNTTCVALPINALVAIDVNHTHPTPTPEEPFLARYFRLPKVPSWREDSTDGLPSVEGVTVRPGVTLDYYSVGETKVTTSKPSIYHLEIPVAIGDQSRPIESITLPNVGNALKDACNVSALHVYSIATTN